MGRSGSVVSVFLALSLIAALAGCGGGGRKTPTPPPVPASVSLSPANQVSIELGATQGFTAAANNQSGTPLSGVPLEFNSSNNAVVTIASNGLACAGSWDSLSNPVVCTPGSVGTAQITASATGVVSPPTTVYVHQHIDQLKITPTPAACVSKDATTNFQATAYSRNTDITSTVGKITWRALDTNVLGLSDTVIGLTTGQVQATAKIPGRTSFYVTVSSVNSAPLEFITCPVQSITLALASGSGNTFSVATGGSETIVPTVIDSANTTITGVPLTWSSSEPSLVSVTTGVARGANPGGASIIGSCTPPTCNIGFLPSAPVYPLNSIQGIVTGTRPATTIWVTSTDCGTIDDCVSEVVPIDTTANAVGTAARLPATPNSIMFNRQSSKAYLGTNRGLQGTKGLMILDPTANPATIQQATVAPGKVLAISPDGNTTIVSDTADTPNQVFIVNVLNNSSTPLLINGATAAAFSPDGLKAYIVAGSTLYVYSKLDALQSINLGAPANDVTFLPNGAFAYLALGGATPSIASRATCSNAATGNAVNASGVVPTIRPVPDGTHILGLVPPNIAVVSANTTSADDCSPAVSNSLTTVNLGQGTFVPLQLLISANGSTAYILASNLPNVLVFDIRNQTTTTIALAGAALPIQAAVTSDGGLLYVAASDGTVHVLDTIAALDLQQVSFPQGLCTSANGSGKYTCLPNLLAAKP